LFRKTIGHLPFTRRLLPQRHLGRLTQCPFYFSLGSPSSHGSHYWRAFRIRYEKALQKGCLGCELRSNFLKVS
jgi:hypothetical protein